MWGIILMKDIFLCISVALSACTPFFALLLCYYPEKEENAIKTNGCFMIPETIKVETKQEPAAVRR